MRRGVNAAVDSGMKRFRGDAKRRGVRITLVEIVVLLILVAVLGRVVYLVMSVERLSGVVRGMGGTEIAFWVVVGPPLLWLYLRK